MTEAHWGKTIILHSGEEMKKQVESIEKVDLDLAASMMRYLSKFAGQSVDSGHLLGEVITAIGGVIAEAKEVQKKDEDVLLPEVIKGRRSMIFAREVVRALAGDVVKSDGSK